MPWRDQDRNPAYYRGWKAARLACLQRAAWRCEIKGPQFTRTAVTADHIYGIRNDPGHKHLQAACQPCHDAKSQGEAARGRRNAPADPPHTPRTKW